MTILRADEPLRVNPRCLLTELGDGTGVVLNLDTKFYFTLNTTGVLLWKELSASASGAPPKALAEKLVEHFLVEIDVAVTDVVAILQTMAEEDLVHPSGATAP